MKQDPKIDVFFGEDKFDRDRPILVSTLKEGKKVMRQKRKEGFTGIVMYYCYMDGEGTSDIYFFDQDGKIKMETSH